MTELKKPLDVISPEHIESVEVIDNPSARYRGNSDVTAVMNIKLKRVGIKPFVRGDLAIHSMPNANFVYSNGAFEVGTSTSSVYLNGIFWRIRKDRNRQCFEDYQGSIQKYMNGDNKSHGSRTLTVNFGGDKEFAKKNYIAYNLKYYAHPYNYDTQYSGRISNIMTGESSPLLSSVANKNKDKQLSSNLYYKHSFADDRTLELSGDYYYSINSNVSDREEISKFFTYKNNIGLNNSRHMGEFDVNYSDMLTEAAHLDVGSKTEYSVTNIDDRLDNWPNFRYRRTREYFFAGIDNNRSESKFNYMISCGLDMVLSDADGVKNHYVDFVPSVSFTYKFKGRQTLTLGYYRSRQMPQAGTLNPRNTSTDVLVVIKGNPLLKPSHADQTQLGYIFVTGGIWLNPYVSYSYFSDRVNSYQYMEGDVVIKTFQNLGHSSNLSAGVTFNYNLPRKKEFRGNLKAGVHYGKMFIKGMSFRGSCIVADLDAVLYYKRISISMNLKYNGSEYYLYTKKGNNFSSSFNFDWRITHALSLNLQAQSFLCPRRPVKSWTKSVEYSSYSSSIRLTRAPMFLVGIEYSFRSKNFRWRQKKQFNGRDGELQTIKTN